MTPGDLAESRTATAADMHLWIHGGFAFAEEHDVERRIPDTRRYQVATISTSPVLSCIGEDVLGLPRPY